MKDLKDMINLKEMQDNGEAIYDNIEADLKSRFGNDFLSKDDILEFALEAGSVAYALNMMNATLASLLIERLVSETDTSAEQAYEEISDVLVRDAREMAKEAFERYKSSVSIVEAFQKIDKSKKPTSH